MNLDALIHEQITPILIGKGFKVRGRIYTRTSDGFQHIVRIDKGQRSTHGRFGISMTSHPLVDDYPGLPKLPLRPIDHWMRRVIAPVNNDDKTWLNDQLYRADIDQIVELVICNVDAWFTDFSSLEKFSESWRRHDYSLDSEAKRFGLLPKRLTYLHAVALAKKGHKAEALKMAKAAQFHCSPQATQLNVWIGDFIMLIGTT